MRRRVAGFTIIEILISIVVVSLALVGILALLAASTKVAGEVVEDSYAATLARSVYESVREGARKRTFAVYQNPADKIPVRGFLFIHEGVKDDGFSPADLTNCKPPLLPAGPNDTAQLASLQRSDFAIFLPPDPAAGGTGGNERYMVYPRPVASRALVAAQNQSFTDNWFTPPHAGHATPVYYDVQRVYSLADRAVPVTTGPQPLSFDQADQYSFTVAIRRAQAPVLNSNDTLPQQADGWKRTNGLYEVEVSIYRNFDPRETSRNHAALPGGRFVELISVSY